MCLGARLGTNSPSALSGSNTEGMNDVLRGPLNILLQNGNAIFVNNLQLFSPATTDDDKSEWFPWKGLSITQGNFDAFWNMVQNKYRQKLIGINNSLGDHFGIIGDKLLRKICFFYINQVSPNISKLFDFLPFVNVTILLKPTELLLMFPWKYQFSLNFIMFWKFPKAWKLILSCNKTLCDKLSLLPAVPALQLYNFTTK